MERVFVIGGTGFLGYHIIQEFLSAGWEVTAIGLPSVHPPRLFPESVKMIYQDLDQASDEELLSMMRGHTALVFAAGRDDRYTPNKPAYPMFHQANVSALARILHLAKDAGIKRAVVLGSYFAYFHRLWPELNLAERHPYIRSRIEQETVAFSIPGLEVMVLELPYIFGSLPIRGWKPLWAPLVKYIRSSNLLFYMQGGTTCISTRTVGRAALAAMERGKAGTAYPIGQENLTWPQMLGRLASADIPDRQIKVITLPTWLISLGMFGVLIFHSLQGRESGLNMRYFSSLQTMNTFIDPDISRDALGYALDDLDSSFRETVKAC